MMKEKDEEFRQYLKYPKGGINAHHLHQSDDNRFMQEEEKGGKKKKGEKRKSHVPCQQNSKRW